MTTAASRNNPHPVFDYLLERFNLKNDRAISNLLEISSPEISKIRCGTVRGRATVALAIHEVFGISFKQMRELGGNDFVAVRLPRRTCE